MTALVSFAQDFQHFHLVRGDRFAPFNAKSRDYSRDCASAKVTDLEPRSTGSVGVGHL